MIYALIAVGGLALGLLADDGIKALKQDRTAEVVAGVSEVVKAGNEPVVAELRNVSRTLEESRLDRHCTPPKPGEVDSQYLFCLAADCWDKQAALGQSGSKTCGDIEDFALRVAACELQPDEDERLACYTKLGPK